MRQIKSGVGRTGNRFSEPVAIARSHILRPVSSMHTALGVTNERAAYTVSNVGHPQRSASVPAISVT